MGCIIALVCFLLMGQIVLLNLDNTALPSAALSADGDFSSTAADTAPTLQQYSSAASSFRVEVTSLLNTAGIAFDQEPTSIAEAAVPSLSTLSAASSIGESIELSTGDSSARQQRRYTPAPWSAGGGSIKYPCQLTIVIVVDNSFVEPSTTAAHSTRYHRLQRAVRGLYRSGVTRHPSFYEVLLMHKEPMSASALEAEEAVIHGWWEEEIEREASIAGPHASNETIPQVRVVAPQRHNTTKFLHRNTAAALLYAIRLVETEYVVPFDLTWAPPTAELYTTSTDPAAPAARRLQSQVQQELTMALQALSKNGCTALSHVLVDVDRHIAVEDVHVYRLQQYITVDARNVSRNRALKEQLTPFLKKLQASIDAKGVTSSSGPCKDNCSTTDAAMTTRKVGDTAPPEDAAAAHFHCQLAPVYSKRVLVPPFLRRKYQTASQLRVTTLCEALLSEKSNMKSYAGDPHGFYVSFCRDWRQLLLTPNPPTRLLSHEEGEIVSLVSGSNGAVELTPEPLHNLCDGTCAVEWLGHLKVHHTHYRDGRAKMQKLQQRRQQQQIYNLTGAVDQAAGFSHTAPLPFSASAGPSPYLSEYTAMLFSTNATQQSMGVSRYLNQVPNTSAALQYLSETVEEKLRLLSLRYAVERTRLRVNEKLPEDREMLCFPSSLCSFNLHPAMYSTQWLLYHVVLPCLQFKERCVVTAATDERSLLQVALFRTTANKWKKGTFRVCLSRGIFTPDPHDKALLQ